MSAEFKIIPHGGITSAKGFEAAALAAGIKPVVDGKIKTDLALLISTEPIQLAATFTTNQVKAAPVKVSMEHARNGAVKGVIINSGNANACTGVRGIKNAREMTELTAAQLGCKCREILVCSTGRIGVELPMAKIRRGIKKIASQLSPDNGSAAAEAIMTTDSFHKEIAVQLKIDGRKITVGGMAKGAGMIHPNMATMLCFLTTDAQIDRTTLQRCVFESVEQSFNRISIDGDTSTNDTVLVFANGVAKNHILKSYHPQLKDFQKALDFVMRRLAQMIVEDGEGITKVVEVAVKGARTDAEAKLAATAVAHSLLVKSSWCGEDPNWGRLMAAVGYSTAQVKEELIDIYYDGLSAVTNGQPSRTPLSKLKRVARKSHFTITIHLHNGRGEYCLLTNDLTEAYVTFNKGTS